MFVTTLVATMFFMITLMMIVRATVMITDGDVGDADYDYT